MSSRNIQIGFNVIRVLLVILLAIIFILSTVYFIRAIDAIGDDVEEARETHYGHEVEENDLEVEGKKRSRFDPYDESEYEYEGEEDPVRGGRLIKGHHHYRVTHSEHKHHHIISLIVWVVLTLFAAILSLAGIFGALCLNPCMVLFCAMMILVHAICSHVLPVFHLTFPNMTSNWLLLALETPAIVLAILFVALHRARQKELAKQRRQRRILY